MKIITMILILAGCLSTIVYADNASRDENRLILEELKEIRSALNRIADELSEIRSSKEKQDNTSQLFSGTLPFNRQGPDIDRLADITLSDDAGPDEVKKYIRDIIKASQGQSTFSDRDPQVAMLAKVGKKNLPLLIDSLTYSMPMHNYHVERAILILSDESSKSVILEALPIHHNLVRAVIQNGWEADARSILLAELKKIGQNLPVEWIRAVASLRDSESYDLLREYFVNGTNRAYTYREIQRFPIENLPEAVAEAWERSKYEQGYSRISMAVIALQYGHLDALEVLVESLASESPDSYWLIQEARPAVLQYTGFTGSNAELKSWFEANRSLLKFDSEKKKFVVDTEGG